MVPRRTALSNAKAMTKPSSPATGGKYLTLFLGAEEYGIEILKVQEIIRVLPITRVPRMPAFVRGVINLRGRIVPVLELRERFGMDRSAEARENCIIVVRTGSLSLGMLVDRVNEVMTVADGEIEPVPDFGVAVDTKDLLGVARRGERVVLLLDIDRAVTRDEAEALVPAG
jgi:purine-binding chemotaxis protein CheW